MQPIIHQSCGIILYFNSENQKKFLLLKYPHGHIDFAKGHIEPGESLLECARRELVEETGISDIEVMDGFLEQINYTYIEENKTHYKTVDFFLAESKTLEVKVSHEHLDFMWLEFDEALKMLTFDNAKHILIKSKAFLDL